MADLDRARLRELAEDAKRAREWLDGADRKRSHQKAVADAVGKLGLFKYEASPDALLALLDALDAAERERDAFKSLMYDEMDANLSFMADAGARPGENIANCLRRLLAERDTLAADARRLDAIRKSLHWDGHGYWLPDWCVKERERLEEAVPEPTLDEFRAAIDALAAREG